MLESQLVYLALRTLRQGNKTKWTKIEAYAISQFPSDWLAGWL